MNHVISIDIGGTNTRVSLVDESLKIIRKTVFNTDSRNPNTTIEKIREAIESFGEQISGIGISCPGPLDLINGIVLTPPNLTGWHNFNLKKSLSEATGLEVFVENDANLAALAEAVIGAGKHQRIVQYMTISTGVGGGLVIDGTIHKGSHGFAQEIANVIVQNGGVSFNDLKPGALEYASSGTGIVDKARHAGMHVNHAGEVNDLAMAGDDVAKKIMDDSKEYLANAIAAAYAFVDPDVVILGGSVALKIDNFVEDVESCVKKKVYDVIAPLVSLKKAQLGDDSGIIGGALLAFQNTKAMPREDKVL